MPALSAAAVTTLRAASQASGEQVEVAAQLLHAQWSRGGSVSEYRAKLAGGNDDKNSNDTILPTTSTPTQLPQSYLLLLVPSKENGEKGDGARQEEVVVGHGRLTECFEGAGGSAAAATYILAEPRGQGHGTRLMQLLEKEAEKLGYHYLYLWTATAVTFYQKLGYTPTERVSLYSACLKTLECAQVNKLEAMLNKKMGNLLSKKKETVMLPPDEAAHDDVWLRKRLVESVGSEVIPYEQRMQEIRAAVDHENMNLSWEYVLLEISWQQQVGPSCGLAALRMLRDHYVVLPDGNNVPRMPSLLTEAQQKGYSADGEIFDAANLVQLATLCGLQTELRSLKQTSPAQVLAILEQGGTLILPYDSQPLTKRPHQNSGKTAHYGIIVGIMFGFRQHTNSDGSACVGSGNSRCIRPYCADDRRSNAEEAAHCRLLVQHSLSKKLAIATWAEFFQSNQQLFTVDTTKYKVQSLHLRDCVIVCHGAKEAEA